MVEQQEPGKIPEQLPFSESTKLVILLAKQEATEFNHNYIGTEHLLLGVIKDPFIAERLSREGFEVGKISSAINFIIGRGERPVSEETIKFTPRAIKAIGLAAEEAANFGRSELLPSDILIGISREGEGVGAGVLDTLGLYIGNLRTRVYKDEITYRIIKQMEEIKDVTLIEELANFFNDPEIDQEKKRLLTDTVKNSIELARRSKPQSTS